MNVTACGQIHDIIRAPARRPDHLIDFFLNRRRHSGVTDIGIDFDKEITANNLRFQLWVVDIGRDNRAARRDLRACLLYTSPSPRDS